MRGSFADQYRVRTVHVMPEFEETLHRRLAYADRFMPLFIVIFAASIGGLIISTLAPDGYFEEVSLVLLGLNFIIFGRV